MATTTQYARPIVAGYAWAQRVRVTASVPTFPDGVALTSHIRRTVADPTVMATLSTADGSLVRIDDDTIELRLSPSASAAWKPGTVILDLVRTDLDTPQHLSPRLTVPVVQPVTRL